MSMQQTVKLTGLPSYWDKANSVRVYMIDFGSDKAYGFAATVISDSTGREGLFVCVSQHLPAERRGKVVRAMLDARARDRTGVDSPVEMAAAGTAGVR